jgi:hypothetical protein
MGRQVGLFADDIDLHDLLAFAENAGFLALPDRIETDDLPQGIEPTQYEMTEETGTECFYLLPPGVSKAEAFYHELSNGDPISILGMTVSPVTEFRPSQREGNKLSDGRIYFNMDRHVTHFEQGKKGYERLARYVRKWQKTRQYRFHVGPHTANEVAKGRLAIVHFNEELSLA